MISNSTLRHGPLYDPKSKIRKFRFEEDIGNIRLNALGTGVLYEDPNFWFYLDHEKEWRRPKEICSRPFFIDGKPHRFDALQGQQGDCWLVNGMEAITLDERLVKHVVPPDQSFDHDYIGAFHFRIWQLGVWYDVVVDDRLPVNKKDKKLCYAHSMRGDVFWAALLEKAYAKICGTSTVSYDNLHEGLAMTGLQDLSGGIIERLNIRTRSSGSTISLKWFMKDVFLKYALMSCECYTGVRRDTGLEGSHGYTVTKVFQCEDDDPDYPGLFLVRMMNPWGHKEWKGDWSDDDFNNWKQIDRELKKKLNIVKRDEGEFWISDKDLYKYFEFVNVCYLGPSQYETGLHHSNLNFKWRTTTFSGEWVNNVSAGGSEVETRHENPQYRILLESPENDPNRDGLCTVVIELVQRSKKGRLILYRSVFYIYSLSKIKNPPMPLDKRFFEDNEPIDNDPDYSASYGRAYLTSMRLEPGKYCIVPCTEKPNSESQFLLRVFSESRVELWEHDTQISKSLPTEQQILNDSDKGLQRLFHDIARGQNEIDWIELKEILEAAMNPKKYYFGIAPFFKFIRNVFEKYLSLRSSNDYETGDVVFTKDECRSMIAMLDYNHSGRLTFSEFSNLWNKISFWTKVFEKHRDETEGCVTVAQLRDALSSIGYDVNKRTVHSLSYVYANDQGNICLTDFILCGVTLETVLVLYHKEYVECGNKITLSLAEWVKNTLIL